MATFPADPALPAATTSTPVNPDFLNTLIDNINAMGPALSALMNGVVDGSIDVAIDKGIKWAGVLEIYFSGGDMILDDSVQITGALDVATTLTVDTIDDSGASFITVNEDMHFAAGKYIDVPTLKVDLIDDSGAVSITVNESMEFAAGKYVDADTGKFDTIDDSGAAVITINETIQMGAGKGIQGDGAATLSILAGAAITGSLDVSGTLSVDTIDDSGAVAIAVLEDMEFAAGKYIDADTGKFDTIVDSGAALITITQTIQLAAGKGIQGDGAGTLSILAGAAIAGNLDVTGTLTVDTINDSGAGVITSNEDMEFAAGKYVDAPTGKFDVIDDSGAAKITINETMELGAGKGIQGDGAGTLSILAGAAITGALTVSTNVDIVGTLTVDTINDSGAAQITIMEDVHIVAGKYIDAPIGKFDGIYDSGAGQITLWDDVRIESGAGDRSLIFRPQGNLVMGLYGSWIGGDTFIWLNKSPGDPGYPGATGVNLYVNASGDFVVKTKGAFTKAITLKNNPPTYAVTNELVDRTYDADTVAIAELADVVGTLINDLISAGLLK